MDAAVSINIQKFCASMHGPNVEECRVVGLREMLLVKFPTGEVAQKVLKAFVEAKKQEIQKEKDLASKDVKQLNPRDGEIEGLTSRINLLGKVLKKLG